MLAPVALTVAATHTPAPVTVRLLAADPSRTPQASRSWTRDDELVATLKLASVSEPGAGTSLFRVAPGLDIPEPALRAFQFAEEVMRRADSACRIDWSLLAAIGDVESDHGRYGGAQVHPDGTSTPRILGPQLDGAGDVAAISDTDDGAVDGDRRWDRAVGPMQFIPSTWSLVGADADGDGVRDPHDVDDAALAAAVYLCAGDDDLSTTAGQEAAVYRYNHSASYVDLVLRLADAYADDVFTLSAPQPTVTRASQPVDVPALTRAVEVGAHPAQPPSGALGFAGSGTTDSTAAAASSDRRARAHAGSDAQSPSRNGSAGDTSSRTVTRGDGDTSDAERDSNTGTGGESTGGTGGTGGASTGGTGGESTGSTDAGSGDSTTRTGENADSTDGSTSGGTSPSDDGDSTTSDNTDTTDGTAGGTASDGGEESGTGGTDGGDGSTNDDTTNDSGDGSTDDGATNESQDGTGTDDGSSPDASGTLTRSDGNWFVGESPVDFGDKDYLAGNALHDFDGVDGTESNLGELETLIDHDVSVVLEGGLVQKLNDMEYR